MAEADEFAEEEDAEFPEDELDDELEEAEPDLEDLDESLDEDVLGDEDDVVDVVDVDIIDPDEIEIEPARRTTAAAAPTTEEGAEEEDDDEDLVEPDDVEAALDTILKDRLVAVEEDADEEDEEVEVDDRGDPVDRILPKRPGEFVCQSCFLVKHPSQLADEVHMYCSDCV
jgi:hypothetical protein